MYLLVFYIHIFTDMARKHFATIKVMKCGRITIPSDIRDVEGIEEGNYVQISIEKIEDNQHRHIKSRKDEK